MSLSSRFENIELAQHLCGKLLDGRNVSEETKHWLLMALREALANAIKHGNRQDTSKRIHLEMDVVGSDLRISIRDEGAGVLGMPVMVGPALDVGVVGQS